MHHDPDAAVHPAVVRLLSEILARLEAAGPLRLVANPRDAAAALGAALLRAGFALEEGPAAAILALREAGWPPARDDDDAVARRVGREAFHCASMLDGEDARHVADFLRHLEEEIMDAPRRDLAAVIPEAERAIAAYGRYLGRRSPVT